jgi:rubrerythrin
MTSAEHQGWTRASFLRSAAAVGTAASVLAIRLGEGDDKSQAAPSSEQDQDILNLFLQFEYAQMNFYRQAVESMRIGGDLRTFARTVGPQEAEHAVLLRRRLRGAAAPRAESPDVRRLLTSPSAFRRAAIDMEEAVIAAYVGEAANLTRDALAEVAPLVSVEARQVAWLRDLAGATPAPRAADPARRPQDVVSHLRAQGLLA